MVMTARQASRTVREICALAPVVPVLVVADSDKAVPLARALVAGGLPALEVTLRTPAALEVIRRMSSVPGGVVGAGTLLTPHDVQQAKQAGARFGVSPGITGDLIAACQDFSLPLLGGVASASEAMRLLERGYDAAKFFPAEASGGAPALKALGGPLPDLAFCPTGGITPANAPDYLALPNVLCVGGSWVATVGALEAGDWDTITETARAAAALAPLRTCATPSDP